MLKELDLKNAYRVTPTGLYLISTAYQGKRNVQFAFRALGIGDEPPLLLIGIQNGNFSREVIQKSGEFVINVCSTEQLRAVDKSRDMSGRNVEDKFVTLGLETLPAKVVQAPLVKGCHANVELRLPLINLAATPIGILGPLRGTVYFGIAGAKFKGEDYAFSTREPGYSYVSDPIFGAPVTGWRLQDGRASWGFGLQLFFLGYPLHFDWTKYTDFATTSKGWDFGFWIGYDF